MQNILNAIGIKAKKPVHFNLGREQLIEHAIQRNEGQLSKTGALVVKTGKKTGRSAQDKFVVAEETSQNKIWWGNNKQISEDKFQLVKEDMLEYLGGVEFYVQDLFAGANPKHQLKIRVINELAWHSMFARNLFICPEDRNLQHQTVDFTVINAPGFEADPARHGTRSGTFILINFAEKLVLIGGTQYAGETKKSIFSVMNYLMPQRGILSMHCSANVGQNGDSALLFGLSGTGKTTLSADPERGLLGDDEHCWDNDGVFNIEGGCYAKCINLSREAEPFIYDAIRFGTVVENVTMDPITRQFDFDDNSITDNSRCAYSLDFIPNVVLPSIGPKPKNIIFLTCDAFGVLPPISKLSPAQAMYHYLLGYTAKIAGTEIGITEPTLTFSPCFGAPFLPLHPTEYAKLLGEKISKENVRCWLVNTGWSGGPYGVGKRMKISHTRAMVNAALSGALDNVEYVEDPIFRVGVPTSCPGVPNEVLSPRNTWVDKVAYDRTAKKLAYEFNENFQKYADFASEEVKAAGPEVAVA